VSRVVVCGTKFGRVYLAALREPTPELELAGILAGGSERSKRCAEHYGVPLWSDPEEVSDDVDLACVVVGSTVNGGPGSELAQALMARGLDVLQEHPLHHDELAGCLKAARRAEVMYRLNTHYVHLEPVRRFVAAARELTSRQQPLYVDATCGIQVIYTLLDILGRALGSVRPWTIEALGGDDAPFRTLAGTIAGVPLTLRVQNELDPGDPDNFAHILHRVTLGTEGGNLTLHSSHGPVLWCPRPHLPSAARDAVVLDEVEGEHLDYPSAEALGPPGAPSYREVMGTLWPAGVRHALAELQAASAAGEDPLRDGQYHLTLCRLWQDVTGSLGYPALREQDEPTPLPAEALSPRIEEELHA